MLDLLNLCSIGFVGKTVGVSDQINSILDGKKVNQTHDVTLLLIKELSFTSFGPDNRTHKEVSVLPEKSVSREQSEIEHYFATFSESDSEKVSKSQLPLKPKVSHTSESSYGKSFVCPEDHLNTKESNQINTKSSYGEYIIENNSLSFRVSEDFTTQQVPGSVTIEKPSYKKIIEKSEGIFSIRKKLTSDETGSPRSNTVVGIEENDKTFISCSINELECHPNLSQIIERDMLKQHKIDHTIQIYEQVPQCKLLLSQERENALFVDFMKNTLVTVRDGIQDLYRIMYSDICKGCQDVEKQIHLDSNESNDIFWGVQGRAEQLSSSRFQIDSPCFEHNDSEKGLDLTLKENFVASKRQHEKFAWNMQDVEQQPHCDTYLWKAKYEFIFKELNMLINLLRARVSAERQPTFEFDQTQKQAQYVFDYQAKHDDQFITSVESSNLIKDQFQELQAKQQLENDKLICSHNQKLSKVHSDYKLIIDKNESDYSSQISLLEDLVQKKDATIADLQNELKNKVHTLEKSLENKTAELKRTKMELIDQIERERILQFEIDKSKQLAMETLNSYQLETEEKFKSIEAELIAQQEKESEISKAYDSVKVKLSNQMSRNLHEQNSLLESHKEQLVKMSREYQQAIDTAHLDAATEVQGLRKIATQGEQIISHLRESICKIQADKEKQIVSLESELLKTKQDLLDQVTSLAAIRSELDTVRKDLIEAKIQHSQEIEIMKRECDDELHCRIGELMGKENQIGNAVNVVEYIQELELMDEEDSNDDTRKQNMIVEHHQIQLSAKYNHSMKTFTPPNVVQDQLTECFLQDNCIGDEIGRVSAPEELRALDVHLFEPNNVKTFSTIDISEQTMMYTFPDVCAYNELQHPEEERSSTLTINIVESTPKQNSAIDTSLFHLDQMSELLSTNSVMDKTSEDLPFVSIHGKYGHSGSREETEITFFRSDSLDEESDTLNDFQIVSQTGEKSSDTATFDQEKNVMIGQSLCPKDLVQSNDEAAKNLDLNQNNAMDAILDKSLTDQNQLEKSTYMDDLTTLKDMILTYICLPDGSHEKDTVFRIVASLCGFTGEDFKKIEDARNHWGWRMSHPHINADRDVSIVTHESQQDYNRRVIKDAFVKYLALSQNSNEGKIILSILGSLLHFTNDDYGRINCVKKQSSIWW